MKKVLGLVCCSLFLFTGCGQTSYFQTTEQTSTEEIALESSLEETKIFVQVDGAVSSPGVYELSPGSRVYMAIDAAGGMTEDADDSDINQAALLEDGQKIYVYSKEERQELEEQSSSDGLIDINTASAQELTTLPGVGQAKAEQIVTYRQSNGSFSSIEDIKKVSGIGDGIFNQINSLIKV